MLTSKAQLISYIRQMLGEPTIQVEVTDDQISLLIDETIGIYTDVVYGDFEETMILPATDLDSRFRVRLMNFTSVLSVSETPEICPGGDPIQGRREFHFHWNNISRTLTLTGFPVPSYMMVIGLTKYKAHDEEDYIFDETWVKAMAKAKTQKLWGQVVGKYSQSLVSGATINFDRIISEAEAEIERLTEELQEKWMDPAPVLVG